MSYLFQTGSGSPRHSTSSMRVPGLSFLPRVRRRSNPSLFHSESSHSSKTPRAEKEETPTSTSRRSSRQTGCGRRPSNLASQRGGRGQRGRRGHATPSCVFSDRGHATPRTARGQSRRGRNRRRRSTFRFQEDHCIRDSLEWLDTLTQNDTRQVNVLVHNFQGYDGYFVVHQYHADNRLVEQLRNGCKLLEVKHDRLRFMDSLSFFQMPLSAFPKTFGLTELRKGYFPHKFNIPDHQSYVGAIPALDYYMPKPRPPKPSKP